jgi:two-component system, NtrC family, sensor kinase
MPRPDNDNQPVSSERLEGASRLAGELAHELNTPLGGILMYSHLLLDELQESDPHLDKVVKINKLAHRCKMIVEGLLSFARQESHPLEEVQVNETLNNVLGFMRDHVLLRNVDINTRLDPQLPRIRGEENKLEQVFINLIINAAQSMTGRGQLNLQTAFDAETKRVTIQVTDTGCGIRRDHRKKIFEPFFTTKSKEKGTGLGLSICHGIIEQHNGSIQVERSDKTGSVLKIELPTSADTTHSTEPK